MEGQQACEHRGRDWWPNQLDLDVFHTQDQTDAQAFAVLEPKADGFRNYLRAGQRLSPEPLLLERANLLASANPSTASSPSAPAR